MKQKHTLNFPERPNSMFEVTVTPEEFEETVEIKHGGIGYLSGNMHSVTVSTESGILLGQLHESAAHLYGPGIEYLEQRGKRPTTNIKIKKVGDQLFGEIGLRKNISDFFWDEVPKHVLEKHSRQQLEQTTAQIQADIDAKNRAREQAQNEYEANRKKGLPMWLLWAFLGGLGAHRFYLGHTKYAVLMLITFFLGGLGLIWALIDAFLINRAMRTENAKVWSSIAHCYSLTGSPAPESATP